MKIKICIDDTKCVEAEMQDTVARDFPSLFSEMAKTMLEEILAQNIKQGSKYEN